ncbi:hypothetical protein HXX76_009591 [Chlamydomonas incerta]|uniref:Ribosomal protein n=1 Tax=Chlamydomonas incerta TaxID=51695 RepID=A0A835VW49_CHLIN|nr:hypothetical protein HXX76_009591 [Chlamydomonas incerta]|eukprot:KAG2431577.1 hypothetical protein HXX76_009591 [Chlamydomonas incerta]
MKVRGKVRLLCEFCRKTVVKLSRDQHYVYIYCTKNPRHKQRTKFVTMASQAGSECCSGHAHEAHQHGHAPAPAAGLPCLPEPPYALVHSKMMGDISRGLLGSRHTSVLGELYWRAAMQQQ